MVLIELPSLLLFQLLDQSLFSRSAVEVINILQSPLSLVLQLLVVVFLPLRFPKGLSKFELKLNGNMRHFYWFTTSILEYCL